MDRFGRLTLGTVQLGQSYGVANPDLPPSEQQAIAVLDAAWECGIRVLDTAQAYGEAEARIGRWCAARDRSPLVVTKLSGFGAVTDKNVEAEVRARLARSCAALGGRAPDGVLLHDPADIVRPEVSRALAALVQEGAIGAFGASVYDPAEAEACFPVGGFGLLQLPYSLFDLRFAETIARCREKGVTVFVRSVYLQGLLFREPASLSGALAEAAPALAGIRTVAREAGVELEALALGAALREPGAASVVVGAYDADQVRATAAAAENLVPPEVIEAAVAAAERLPAALRDPRHWPAR